MAVKSESDVLVVGAGPVGLLAATVALHRGLSVQIVDEAWRTGAHSYALALHPQALRLLASVNLIDQVLPLGRKIGKVAYYDGTTRRGEVDLAALSQDFPFVLVLRQDALETILEDALRQEDVRVHWNHQVAELSQDGGQVGATVHELEKSGGGYAVAQSSWVVRSTQHTTAKYVIGADGHRSIVRRTLGIESEEASPPEYFGVFEFQAEGALPDEVRVVMDDYTTNVLWPLPQGQARWSFQLTGQTMPGAFSRRKGRLALQVAGQSFPTLERGDLERFIQTRAPWFDTGVGDIDWAMAVRFEHRLARRFGNGRCWLAGDAAHMAGPVGVQSMNVGLAEAAMLGITCAQVLQQNAPTTLLEEYHRQQHAYWETLLGMAGELTALPDASDWVKTRAARLLATLPASGEVLGRMAQQLGLKLDVVLPHRVTVTLEK